MEILQVIVRPLAAFRGNLARKRVPAPAHDLRHVAEKFAASRNEAGEPAVLVRRHGIVSGFGVGEVAGKQRSDIGKQPAHAGHRLRWLNRGSLRRAGLRLEPPHHPPHEGPVAGVPGDAAGLPDGKGGTTGKAFERGFGHR